MNIVRQNKCLLDRIKIYQQNYPFINHNLSYDRSYSEKRKDNMWHRTHTYNKINKNNIPHH